MNRIEASKEESNVNATPDPWVKYLAAALASSALLLPICSEATEQPISDPEREAEYSSSVQMIFPSQRKPHEQRPPRTSSTPASS
jgi:hypothetical protein